MIKDVGRIDANLQALRFRDAERFAQIAVERPATHAPDRVLTEVAHGSRSCLLQQNRSSCRIGQREQRAVVVDQYMIRVDRHRIYTEWIGVIQRTANRTL